MVTEELEGKLLAIHSVINLSDGVNTEFLFQDAKGGEPRRICYPGTILPDSIGHEIIIRKHGYEVVSIHDRAIDRNYAVSSQSQK